MIPPPPPVTLTQEQFRQLAEYSCWVAAVSAIRAMRTEMEDIAKKVAEEVAASGLMEKLWPAFRRLYQGLIFGNMGNKGERGTARGDDGGDAEFINLLIEFYWILDEGSKMAAEANLRIFSPCGKPNTRVCGWLHCGRVRICANPT